MRHKHDQRPGERRCELLPRRTTSRQTKPPLTGCLDCGREVEQLAALAGVGVTAIFCPGQTIVIEGDPIRHHFRIVSGTVRLYKAIADGRRQVIDFLGAGNCFGLIGIPTAPRRCRR
jgi:CRP-like cAMP-binding protein